MNFQGKIQGSRKQGAGASSSTVSTILPVENKTEWLELKNALDHEMNPWMILNKVHRNLVDFSNVAKKILIQKI